VVAVDGTDELRPMLASLPAGVSGFLGLIHELGHTDMYGAIVRITNTGATPVTVQPENITLQLGAESMSAHSLGGQPHFLERTRLNPGEQTLGMVVYSARIDVGAAMRLGAGQIVYTDPDVEVTYGR
jgi:hypothetical protein